MILEPLQRAYCPLTHPGDQIHTQARDQTHALFYSRPMQPCTDMQVIDEDDRASMKVVHSCEQNC